MNNLGDFEETPGSKRNRIDGFEINNSVESIAFIEQLKTSSKDIMMELIYKAIVQNEMGALQNDVPTDEKIEALQTVIRYFSEREEYEKCSDLKQIINKIC
jgi:hypothetical protein|tara:strand:- start:7455 stop:7757 length:303 start_codon:yes stop_codon:yes gene_type:complete